jgi:probable rRNA maturation factor
MKSSLKCYWEFENTSIIKALPLKIIELQRCLKILHLYFCRLEEWKSAEKILGYSFTHFGILVCTEDSMRAYQRQFRQLNRSTDVLSFPAMESPEGQEKGYLGDMIISLSNVERNAKRYRCAFREEFARVWLHSILHLIGMDHVDVSKKKSQRMMEVQELLLQKLSPVIYKKGYERKITRHRKQT